MALRYPEQPAMTSRSNEPPPSSSPTSRAFFCGRSARATPERIDRIIARIMSLPEDRVGPLLDAVSAEFSQRHQQIRQRFFGAIRTGAGTACRQMPEISEQRRLLIGSYFLAEYSLESAALFNPSIVPHPDQTGLPPARCASFSACAPPEKGTSPPSRFEPASSIPISGSRCCPPAAFSPSRVRSQTRSMRRRCSSENSLKLGLTSEFTRRVHAQTGETRSRWKIFAPVCRPNSSACRMECTQEDQDAAQGIWMLARSNYEVQFQPEQELSERIIFPATPSQRNGIEDARFVRFRNDDGSARLLRDVHRLRRQGGRAGTGGDLRLPPLPLHHPERSGRARTKAWRCSRGRSTAAMPCSPARTTRTST